MVVAGVQERYPGSGIENDSCGDGLGHHQHQVTPVACCIIAVAKGAGLKFQTQ